MAPSGSVQKLLDSCGCRAFLVALQVPVHIRCESYEDDPPIQFTPNATANFYFSPFPSVEAINPTAVFTDAEEIITLFGSRFENRPTSVCQIGNEIRPMIQFISAEIVRCQAPIFSGDEHVIQVRAWKSVVAS